MLIRAGSTPVTRTTGSAGPKHRGLTLLTFFFSTRRHSFVINTHKKAVPTAKRRCLCCRISLFCARWHSFVINTRTISSVHNETELFQFLEVEFDKIFILSIDKHTKECYYLNADQNFYF